MQDNETNAVVPEDATSNRKAKKVKTPEEKKKARKKGLIITGSIVGVLVLAVVIIAIGNAICSKNLVTYAQSFDKVEYASQLVPVQDTDGYYTFHTDGDLRVLQLTDIHIGGGLGSSRKDKWAMNAVASMITAEKPDLVVVTGDIAYPVPHSSTTFNNISSTHAFAELMESLGVYWTLTYGNHDTESYSTYTRSQLTDWHRENDAKYTYCLFKTEGSDEFGYGNDIIKVKNSAGEVTQAIVTLDSHSYTNGDYFGALWKYDNIHQVQIDWYATEMDKLKAANPSGNYPANYAFFHIPVREYRKAWKEVVDAGKDNILGSGEVAETPIEAGENTTLYFGHMGESNKKNSEGEMTYGVYCGVINEELEGKFFGEGLTHNMKGMFCGHDHYNNFSVDYKGIRLTYGMSIDYLAYLTIWKEKEQRGCTLLTLKADGSFDLAPSSYYLDKYLPINEKQ